MTFIIGLVVGFSLSSLITARMLALKANNKETLCIDEEGSVYWKKYDEIIEPKQTGQSDIFARFEKRPGITTDIDDSSGLPSDVDIERLR